MTKLDTSGGQIWHSAFETKRCDTEHLTRQTCEPRHQIGFGFASVFVKLNKYMCKYWDGNAVYLWHSNMRQWNFWFQTCDGVKIKSVTLKSADATLPIFLNCPQCAPVYIQTKIINIGNRNQIWKSTALQSQGTAGVVQYKSWQRRVLWHLA